MARLRGWAKQEDRSMSELIRRATESWLDSLPDDPPLKGQGPAPPTFDLGGIKVPLEDLREHAYEVRETH
jgi:hypothetical protein